MKGPLLHAQPTEKVSLVAGASEVHSYIENANTQMTNEPIALYLVHKIPLALLVIIRGSLQRRTHPRFSELCLPRQHYQEGRGDAVAGFRSGLNEKGTGVSTVTPLCGSAPRMHLGRVGSTEEHTLST